MQGATRAALKAGTAYFAIVFLGGFILGTMRVLLLTPRFGEMAAVLAELPIMLALSWFACRLIVQQFAVPPQIAPRLIMGVTAYILLMAAEAAVALTLFGQSGAQFLQGFTRLPGELGLAGQIAFAILPLIEGLKHKR